MSSMGGVSLSQSGMLPVFEPVKNPQDVAPAEKEPRLDADTGTAVEGVKVTISGAALKAASAQKSQNSDIEDSGLPESIQNILKMIREIRKQIAEKMARLQEVMTNRSLSPEQARAQASALQSEIAGLNSALIMASASLSKAMKDSQLNAEDTLKAGSLAMQ